MGRRFGSAIGWAILNAVADGVEILQYATYRPTALLRYGLQDLKTMDALRARRRMQQAAQHLKRQKLLEVIEENGRRAFRLTELGKATLFEAHEAMPPLLGNGNLTIVSFDIPEKYAKVRRSFRRYLKGLGFRRHHQSVWTSDRDWIGRLRMRMQDIDVKDWVCLIQGRLIIPS
jgi:hypothetical protein